MKLEKAQNYTKISITSPNFEKGRRIACEYHMEHRARTDRYCKLTLL